MAVRFNAPPGWPEPPSREWLPPFGWEPSPDWPEPPPGWELYLESRGEQPTVGASRSRYGRLMRVRETPVDTASRVWHGTASALSGKTSMARTAGVVTALVVLTVVTLIALTAWASSLVAPNDAVLTPSVASDNRSTCTQQERATGWCSQDQSDGARVRSD